MINSQDEFGRTKLHYSNDLNEIIECINSNYDLNHQDINGWTPLHFMSQSGNSKAIELLLKHGANPNIHDKYGNGPLWTATMNAHGKYDCIINLLSGGANANHINKHGRSPLIMAKTIKGGLEEIYDKYFKA